MEKFQEEKNYFKVNGLLKYFNFYLAHENKLLSDDIQFHVVCFFVPVSYILYEY